MSNKTNIDIYMSELEISKQDIKGAIQSKGVTPSGGLSSYAEAILSIPTSSVMGSLEETITENGEYTFNPIDNGVEGYNKVDITVDIEIPEIPTFETQSKSVEIKKNGTQTITPDNGYDGLSSVEVKVNVASSGGGKTQIPNGFRFTSGDMAAVDFSQYDWSMVYDTSNFFKGCTHSTGDWSNFEQNFNGEVMSGVSMFESNDNITSIPQMDTSKMMDGKYMFRYCINLTSIPQMDTSKVTNMSYMFASCSNLTSIPQMDTSKVTNMSYMFASCSNLTSIPQMDTSKVTDMNNMFYGCSKLTSIPQMDTSKVTNMNNMFYGCSKIEYISPKDVSKSNNLSNMFYRCSELKNLPIKKGSFIKAVPSNPFNTCNKLPNTEMYKLIDMTFNSDNISSSDLFSGYNLKIYPPIDFSMKSTIGGSSYTKGFLRGQTLGSIEEMDVSYWDGTVGKKLPYFFLADNQKYMKYARFLGDPTHLDTTNLWYGTWDSKYHYTLYYDKRYDYSNVISKMPTTWSAEPFPYGDSITSTFRVLSNGDWLKGQDVKVGTDNLLDAQYKGEGIYEVTIPKLNTMRDLAIRVGDDILGFGDVGYKEFMSEDRYDYTKVIEGQELANLVTEWGNWVYEEGVGLCCNEKTGTMKLSIPYIPIYDMAVAPELDSSVKMRIDVASQRVAGGAYNEVTVTNEDGVHLIDFQLPSGNYTSSSIIYPYRNIIVERTGGYDKFIINKITCALAPEYPTN